MFFFSIHLTVKWASVCYAKLPFFHKNANCDMWYFYFKSMLNNANVILDELFEEYQPAASSASSSLLSTMATATTNDASYGECIITIIIVPIL